MPSNPAAERLDQHLRAQQMPRYGLFSVSGTLIQSISYLMIHRIVCAHRPAEDDGAGVIGHGLGQFLPQWGTAHVEPMALGFEHLPDPARRGIFLMEYDQNGPVIRRQRFPERLQHRPTLLTLVGTLRFLPLGNTDAARNADQLGYPPHQVILDLVSLVIGMHDMPEQADELSLLSFIKSAIDPRCKAEKIDRALLLLLRSQQHLVVLALGKVE